MAEPRLRGQFGPDAVDQLVAKLARYPEANAFCLKTTRGRRQNVKLNRESGIAWRSDVVT